jgi:hypothetical protein
MDTGALEKAPNAGVAGLPTGFPKVIVKVPVDPDCQFVPPWRFWKLVSPERPDECEIVGHVTGTTDAVAAGTTITLATTGMDHAAPAMMDRRLTPGLDASFRVSSRLLSLIFLLLYVRHLWRRTADIPCVGKLYRPRNITTAGFSWTAVRPTHPDREA